MNRARRTLVFAAPLVLAGCSVLPTKAYVEPTDWPLVVQLPRFLPPKSHAPVLLVRSLSAAPGLDREGLQILEPNGSLHVSFYDRWAVPPAEGVTNGLRQWLAASGIFAAVVSPGSRLSADWVLEGELTALYADQAKNVARAALTVVIIRQRNGKDRAADQQRFTAAVPISSFSAPGIVKAERLALAKIFGRIQVLLSATI